jgi:hypothetical protein
MTLLLRRRSTFHPQRADVQRTLRSNFLVFLRFRTLFIPPTPRIARNLCGINRFHTLPINWEGGTPKANLGRNRTLSRFLCVSTNSPNPARRYSSIAAVSQAARTICHLYRYR